MLQLSQIWLCLKAVWRKIAASRADEEVELQMVNLPRWFTLGLEQRCSNPALEGRDQVWFSVLDQAGFSVLRGRKQLSPTWPSGFRTLSLENGSLFWEWSPQKQHFIHPKVLKVAGKAFGQHCRNNRILCSSAAGRDSDRCCVCLLCSLQDSERRPEELNPAEIMCYQRACNTDPFPESQPAPAYPPVTFLPQNPYQQHPTNEATYSNTGFPAPGPRAPFSFPKEQSV